MNGFATKSGCQKSLGGYNIPDEWWSRRYEYPWAAKFIRMNDVVVDAGCGITHFFKYWLAEHARRVYAVDTDMRLLSLKHKHPNLELVQASLTDMPIETESVDKIVCISVLEHMKDLQGALAEFDRVLKRTGWVIVTLDVPTIRLPAWRNAVAHSIFSFAGRVRWSRPADILVEPAAHAKQVQSSTRRMVFCCVLRK